MRPTALLSLWLLISHINAISAPTSSNIRVCFTPQQLCTQELIHYIDHAHHSIELQGYAFTSRSIAKALIRAQHRHVNVRVILDRSQFDKTRYSAVGLLWHAQIPVWEDNTLRIAHNKVIIVDDKLVETGSFNYTYSAQHYNAENLIIIKDHSIAMAYKENWLYRQKLSILMPHHDPSAKHSEHHTHHE